MPVQFDTGSSSAYLITDNCKTGDCDGLKIKKYQTKESKYFLVDKPLDQGASTEATRSEIQYGHGFIAGDISTDMVCFQPPPN